MNARTAQAVMSVLSQVRAWIATPYPPGGPSSGRLAAAPGEKGQEQ
jgi:hypothetical protein